MGIEVVADVSPIAAHVLLSDAMATLELHGVHIDRPRRQVESRTIQTH